MVFIVYFDYFLNCFFFNFIEESNATNCFCCCLESFDLFREEMAKNYLRNIKLEVMVVTLRVVRIVIKAILIASYHHIIASLHHFISLYQITPSSHIIISVYYHIIFTYHHIMSLYHHIIIPSPYHTII